MHICNFSYLYTIRKNDNIFVLIVMNRVVLKIESQAVKYKNKYRVHKDDIG